MNLHLIATHCTSHIAQASFMIICKQHQCISIQEIVSCEPHLACFHVVLAICHEHVHLADIVLHELNHERHCQVYQTILPRHLHTSKIIELLFPDRLALAERCHKCTAWQQAVTGMQSPPEPPTKFEHTSKGIQDNVLRNKHILLTTLCKTLSQCRQSLMFS